MTPEISLVQTPAQTPAHIRHGSNIGQPLTRRDGLLKVTGQARYAADNHPPGMLHAVLAVSTIARGRVTLLDVTTARAHPGVVEAGLAAAKHRIEAIYETPPQYHNAMEPHAIVATWEGDRLLVDTPSQGLAWAQARIAGLFGIPPENIQIRSPFQGGGFGSKGMISGPQVLGILAARLVGRPVKLVLRREQMY